MEKEEKLAEFIGIMLGDGSISIYNTRAGNRIKVHRTIKVTLDSRNKEYIGYVCNLFRDILQTEPRVYYKKKENAVDISTHRKDKLNYILNDIKMQMSPKWNTMKIPEKYSKGKFGLLVLKGLFDTDGCLNIFDNNGTRYPRIEIKVCPSPAQEQFKNILDEFGFVYRSENLDRGGIRLRISGVNELKRWFNLIGSANPIHINKAEEFL